MKRNKKNDLLLLSENETPKKLKSMKNTKVFLSQIYFKYFEPFFPNVMYKKHLLSILKFG